MKLSSEGYDFIVSFEGLHRKIGDGRYVAYKCPAGVWTIYAGCTEGVKPGMVVTEEEGREMFRHELAKFEAAVDRLVTVELNQNEYDSCVSLSYNIGISAFGRSTILRRLNANDRAGAAKAFAAWNKGGGRVLPGLVRRRREEAALFLAPVEAADEPDMPQAVEPSPEKPSRPVVAVASAAGSGGVATLAQVSPDPAALIGCNSVVSCASSFGVFAGAKPTFIAAVAIAIAAIWIVPLLWRKKA